MSTTRRTQRELADRVGFLRGNGIDIHTRRDAQGYRFCTLDLAKDLSPYCTLKEAHLFLDGFTADRPTIKRESTLPPAPKQKGKAYLAPDDLTPEAQEWLKLAAKEDPELLVWKWDNTWYDDHAPCVDVQLNGLRVSFLWLVDDAAAAFHYAGDSKEARKVCAEVLREQVEQMEEVRELDEAGQD